MINIRKPSRLVSMMFSRKIVNSLKALHIMCVPCRHWQFIISFYSLAGKMSSCLRSHTYYRYFALVACSSLSPYVGGIGVLCTPSYLWLVFVVVDEKQSFFIRYVLRSRPPFDGNGSGCPHFWLRLLHARLLLQIEKLIVLYSIPVIY